MDEYAKLAQKAIEVYVKKGFIIPPPADFNAPRAGAFVSLHLKNGDLRGCIGTFAPTKKTLAEEIISNAIAAAARDPRFSPIIVDELASLEFSVDILSSLRKVSEDFNFDPEKYGLIVSASDGRRGLLLPDLAGVETPEQQETICRQKAGIGPKEIVSYQIFTVQRHH